MNYIKTYESYNREYKDNGLVSKVLYIIEMRDEIKNLKSTHIEWRKEKNNNPNISYIDINGYIKYDFAFMRYLCIKNVENESNIVDINNKPFKKYKYDVVLDDTNDGTFRLDVSDELSQKLYNKLNKFIETKRKNKREERLDISTKNIDKEIEEIIKKDSEELGLY